MSLHDLSRLGVRVRPLRERWPRDETTEPERSRFDTTLSKTARTLARELEHLGAEAVTLEIDVPPSQIRNDGLPYANAKPRRQGVILTFETEHGHTPSFAADQYDDWQDNLRAITLTLEALRAVERWGAVQGGGQYAGLALPGAGGSTSTMTARGAAGIILGNGTPTDPDLFGYERLRREARRRLAEAHPDAGGTTERFHLVQEAKKRLSAHFGEEL